MKLVAVPAGRAGACAHALGLAPLERQVAVVLAAVPTAPSAYILAVQMNGTGAPVALLISSGTLIAALTLPSGSRGVLTAAAPRACAPGPCVAAPRHALAPIAGEEVGDDAALARSIAASSVRSFGSYCLALRNALIASW